MNKEFERSLITTYRKSIYRPFTKAVNDYKLINDGDHICVCISGGKDSFLLAKCMQELEKYGKAKIKCEYVLMDPGFSKKELDIIKENSKKLGIVLTIKETKIFDYTIASKHKSPCFICARMRRGALYSIAKELDCNKIALGHHFDDVISTTFLSIFYNGIYNTMLPIVDSENFEGLKLIRPLYYVRENSIIDIMNRFDLKFSGHKCPLNIKSDSKRKKIREYLEKLENDDPNIIKNIFRSADNVDLDHVRGYFTKDKHFDNFDI